MRRQRRIGDVEEAGDGAHGEFHRFENEDLAFVFGFLADEGEGQHLLNLFEGAEAEVVEAFAEAVAAVVGAILRHYGRISPSGRTGRGIGGVRV